MNQDRLAATLRRHVDNLRAVPLGQKAILLVSVLAVVAGGWVFLGWATTPTYAPLFSNLASKDASAIVDELDAAGTKYELADGGQTVMVPKEQLYQLRLKMSAAGLPAQADTGYALLDQQGVTTSEFMQQVGYQRALEGELTKTIGAIDGVNTATVHLVIPKKDVFSDDASKPTAAIMVDTSAGKKLSSEQVQAVVHLVASSVEGLDPSDITVATSDGTVLAAPGQGAAGGGGAGGREQETASFEARLGSSLQQLLTQVVGPNHAVVQVTADLDFDQSEVKSQTYKTDPGTAALSESSTNETYTGTGANAGGVLGQSNGTALTGTGTDGTGNGTYAQTKTVRDNAVNTVIETRQSAPGKVRKLGLAVLLDQTAAAKIDMVEVQRLASSAVGLDATRGDTIAVSAMPFDQSVAEQNQQDVATAQAAEAKVQQLSLIKTAAAVLGGVILFLMLLVAARRQRKRSLSSRVDMRKLDEITAELERNRVEALAAGSTLAALPAANRTPELTQSLGPPSRSGGPQERKLKEIEALVNDQPDEVARLLRGWLSSAGAER